MTRCEWEGKDCWSDLGAGDCGHLSSDTGQHSHTLLLVGLSKAKQFVCVYEAIISFSAVYTWVERRLQVGYIQTTCWRNVQAYLFVEMIYGIYEQLNIYAI